MTISALLGDQDTMLYTQGMVTTLVVTMGIPASGKSTYVERWSEQLIDNGLNPPIICPDDIRKELTGDASDQTRNHEVFELAHVRLALALADKQPVVFFDATNIKPFARDNLLTMAQDAGAYTILAVLSANIDAAKARNKARDRVVPESAMDRMHKEFMEQLGSIEDEGWNRVVYV